MKTTNKILFATLFLLASGSSGFFAFSQEYDDVYYSPKKSAKQPTVNEQATTTESPVGNERLLPKSTKDSTAAIQNTEGMTEYERYSLEKEKEFLGESKSKTSATENANLNYTEEAEDTLYNEEDLEANDPDYSEYYQTDDGGMVVNNYYLDETDDYDFYYSSRFRRFHSPYYGYSYYDPWFSDMYYYTYDPFYWGTSIYFGNRWGGFGYYDYYSPYSYGWGSPYYYGSYYSGYNGYYNNYNDNYWGGSYYNNQYRNNYYGHRTSRSSISPNGSARYAGTPERKTSNANDPRYRSAGTSADGVRKAYSGDNSRTSGAVTRTSNGNAGISRGTSQGTTRTSNGNVRSAETQTGATRQNSTGTYTRPSSRDYTPSYSKPRTSTSPGYNRSGSTYKSSGSENNASPKTGNTYTRPAQNSRSTGSRPATSSGSSYSRPATGSSSSSRPSSGSSGSYSRPSSSGSSGSSSPSYSSGSSSSGSRSSYSSGSSSSGSRSSYSGGSSSSGSSSSGGSRSAGSSSSSSGSSRSSSSSSGSGSRR